MPLLSKIIGVVVDLSVVVIVVVVDDVYLATCRGVDDIIRS